MFIAKVMKFCISVLNAYYALSAAWHKCCRRELVVSRSPALLTYEDIILRSWDLPFDRDECTTPLWKNNLPWLTLRCCSSWTQASTQLWIAWLDFKTSWVPTGFIRGTDGSNTGTSGDTTCTWGTSLSSACMLSNGLLFVLHPPVSGSNLVWQTY